MPPFITALLLWYLIALILWLPIFLGLAKRSSNNDLLLQSQPSEIENFPKSFRFLFILLNVFCMSIGFFSFFILPPLTSIVQFALYARSSDTIVFISPYTKPLASIPSLFVGIFVWLLLIKTLSQLWPHFDRYRALRSRFGWKMALISNFIIVWLALGPLYVLAVDTYIRLTPSGIAFNSILTTEEIFYRWSDISNAKLYARTDVDRYGQKNILPIFETEMKNGKKEFIWDNISFALPEPQDIIAAVELLQREKVPVTFQPLTEEQQQLLQKYGYKAAYTVLMIFQYLESTNTSS